MRVGDEVWIKATVSKLGESGQGYHVLVKSENGAAYRAGYVEAEVPLSDIKDSDDN